MSKFDELDRLKQSENKNEQDIGDKLVKAFESSNITLRLLKLYNRYINVDYALRYPTNEPMMKVTNKKTGEYWELPMSDEDYNEVQYLVRETLLRSLKIKG